MGFLGFAFWVRLYDLLGFWRYQQFMDLGACGSKGLRVEDLGLQLAGLMAWLRAP